MGGLVEESSRRDKPVKRRPKKRLQKRENNMGWLIPGCMVAMIVILGVTLRKL